jgi:hypothetical protein
MLLLNLADRNRSRHWRALARLASPAAHVGAAGRQPDPYAGRGQTIRAAPPGCDAGPWVDPLVANGPLFHFVSIRNFKNFTSAERFCRSYDELRNFLRPRTRHNRSVSTNR